MSRREWWRRRQARASERYERDGRSLCVRMRTTLEELSIIFELPVLPPRPRSGATRSPSRRTFGAVASPLASRSHALLGLRRWWPESSRPAPDSPPQGPVSSCRWCTDSGTRCGLGGGSTLRRGRQAPRAAEWFPEGAYVALSGATPAPQHDRGAPAAPGAMRRVAEWFRRRFRLVCRRCGLRPPPPPPPLCCRRLVRLRRLRPVASAFSAAASCPLPLPPPLPPPRSPPALLHAPPPPPPRPLCRLRRLPHLRRSVATGFAAFPRRRLRGARVTLDRDPKRRRDRPARSSAPKSRAQAARNSSGPLQRRPSGAGAAQCNSQRTWHGEVRGT